MKIKSFLARPFASYIYKHTQKGMSTALKKKKKVLKELLKTGKITEFGMEHHFKDIDCYEAFQEAVPIQDRARPATAGCAPAMVAPSTT